MTDRATYCHDCGEPVQLAKDSENKLKVRCDCNERYIKVKKATPDEWV